GKFETGRHDTNYGRGLAVNANALANDVGIAVEITLPDFIAQNRDFFGAGFVVFGSEIASHNRGHADDFEEVLGDVSAGVTLRIILVGDIDGRSTEVASRLRKRLLRGAQIFVILSCRNVADAKVIILRARLRIDQAHAHQLFRMRKRKTAQDEAVHDSELRSYAADAETENEHGEKTKRFFL